MFQGFKDSIIEFAADLSEVAVGDIVIFVFGFVLITAATFV